MEITKEMINEKADEANKEFCALRDSGNYEQHTINKMGMLNGKLEAYNEMLRILLVQ